MKCLVFSDAHGYTPYIREVIRMHPDAEAVFFLGDGLREVDMLRLEYPDKFWIAVKGNCDFYSYFNDLPAQKTETVRIGGYTVTATHGDICGAKNGNRGLINLALKTGTDILLFGHTHSPYTEYVSDYERPIYLFNPGSISESSGSFGIMTLGDNVLFSHGQII